MEEGAGVVVRQGDLRPPTRAAPLRLRPRVTGRNPPPMSSPSRTHAPLGVLLILGALIAVAPMSIDMYLPALPEIGRDLNAGSAGAELTVAAFLIGLSVGQLAYGPLSDRIGRRPPVLAGGVLYVAVSVGCALATTVESLVVLRVLQALGGCAGIVVSRAVVRDRFDHQQSARIFSLLMLIMGLAPILAPLVGGWILGAAGWRAIFWLLAVFGVVTTLAVLLRLPESRSEETAARARAERPVAAYLAILKNRAAVGYILVGAAASAAMFTYIAASAELLIQTYEIAPQDFGWIFGTNAAGIIGASQLNRALLKRFDADAILTAGLAVACTAALILVGAALSGFGGMWGVLVPLFFCIAIHGLGSPNAVAGAMAMDPHRAGSVSALVGFAQFGLGAGAAGLVGVLHDGTARPMAIVIAACLFGALAVLLLVVAPTRRAAARIEPVDDLPTA